jgi:hypothetical protein
VERQGGNICLPAMGGRGKGTRQEGSFESRLFFSESDA